MAMQIAALNPRFLDKSQVDQATLDEEDVYKRQPGYSPPGVHAF